MTVLPVDDQSDVVRVLSEELDSRTKTLDKEDRYYRGELPRLVDADESIPNYNQIIQQAKTPWAQLVVDVAAERMAVEGFRVITPAQNDDDAEADALCWDIWSASDCHLWSQVAFRDMLLHRSAYLLVESGDGDDLPALSFESPRTTAVLRAPGGRRAAAALKRWSAGGSTVAVLWTPGGATTWTRAAGESRWRPAEEPLAVNNTGMVPVFEMLNRPGLDDASAAMTDLDGLYPALDRATQTTADRLTAQMYSSRKIRYLIGVEPEVDEDGKPTERTMRLAADRLLFIEDPNGKVGSLEETDLRPLIEAERSDVGSLASIARLPVHLLPGDLTNLSAEALSSLMDALAARIRQRHDFAGTSLQRGIRLSLEMMGDERVLDPRTRIEVIWADPQPKSLTDMATAASTLVGGGVLSKSAAQDYALSLTPTQIDKYAQLERADALTSQGVADIRSLFSGAPEPEGAPVAGG